MGRRLAAGIVAGMAFVHLVALALLPGLRAAAGAPSWLLPVAFLLAFVALVAALSVVFAAPVEERGLARFRLACSACATPADAAFAFCTRCGERA